ncbi:MAG: C40 family peptidase [Bacteroidota bacterium]
MKGISTLSIIPVRKEPGDRAEMVTQLLFGETFQITATEKSWSKIKVDYDGYVGWIDTKQATNIGDEEANKLAETPMTVSLDFLQLVLRGTEMTPVVLGSSLPFYYGKKFFISEKEYLFEGNVKTVTQPDKGKIAEHAMMYSNAPYLWGGRSPFGLDCSGFTQMVFKLSGIKILRDANEQAGQGKKVTSLEDTREGDLAFFKNAENKIVHVGIVLNNNRIIHASGKVRIDTLDQQGILNSDTGKHTHALAEIRRIH